MSRWKEKRRVELFSTHGSKEENKVEETAARFHCLLCFGKRFVTSANIMCRRVLRPLPYQMGAHESQWYTAGFSTGLLGTVSRPLDSGTTSP